MGRAYYIVQSLKKSSMGIDWLGPLIYQSNSINCIMGGYG
jgi:hypothetical protein